MTGRQRLFYTGVSCTSQQDSWLRMAGWGGPVWGPSLPAGTAALSYLSGEGQCSWEGLAGAGTSWAWLGEAQSDRVSHFLVHGRGLPRGGSPHLGESGGGGAPSRAAVTCGSCWLLTRLPGFASHEPGRRLAPGEGGGEAEGGEGAL